MSTWSFPKWIVRFPDRRTFKNAKTARRKLPKKQSPNARPRQIRTSPSENSKKAIPRRFYDHYRNVFEKSPRPVTSKQRIFIFIFDITQFENER